MVIAKESPQGIDVLIKKIQDNLNEQLEWANLITIYPRCYRTVREIEGRPTRLIEHVYNNGEYVNLVNADENKCFFVQSGDVERASLNRYSTELELYFTLDLYNVKPDIIHRADEEVHADVLNILKQTPDVQINRLITGIEDVYRGLSYKANDDTHPNHCFKVVIDVLRFDINAKC